MRKTLISSLTGAAVLASLALAQPANAAIIYTNNFEGTAGCSFTCSLSGGTVLAAPNGSTHFLGDLGQGATATLTLSGLSAHSTVTLGFTLDVVGSMDGTGPTINGNGSGDFFTVGYSGSGTGTPFDYAFANYGGGNEQSYPVAGSAPTTGASSINGLGYSGFPDSGNGVQDSEYNFSANGTGPLGPIVITDSGSSLTITFTGLSNEALDNEFYGIDNLVVQTNARAGGGGTAANVPEPAPVLLMGIGLAALVVGKRRRRS